MDHDKQANSPSDAADLVQQIEQCQAALTEQQRSLLRTPDDQARATALRNSGVLVRRLGELKEKAQKLDREFQAQAMEQQRLRALQEVSAAVNSSLDLEIVLQQVMDAIVRLTRAERAMLLMDNNGEMEVRMARNLSQPKNRLR